MVAKIELTGNAGVGCTVRVILPIEWCNQFAGPARVAVLGENLCPTWGLADGEHRVREYTYGSTQVALERAEHIRQEIRTARDALQKVIAHEIFIEL